MNDDLDPPRVYYSFKPTEHRRVSEADATEHPEPIDVRKILKDNVAAEGRSAAGRSKPTAWKARRKRDYLLLLTIPNLIIAVILVLLPKNAATLVFGLSTIVLYSIALTWLMWVVMGDD